MVRAMQQQLDIPQNHPRWRVEAPRLLEEPPSQRTYTRNDAAVTTQSPPASRDANKVDKRSLDYLLRTGFAGGLAGCAVSFLPCFHSLTPSMYVATKLTRVMIGQNRGRSPRSSQDSFPGVESPVCQIYRELVRSFHGDEGHQSSSWSARLVSWPFRYSP